MFLAKLLSPLTDILGGVLDKTIVDKNQVRQIKADFVNQVMLVKAAELEAQSQILVAEISGESWLQRNWRPIVMLFFVGLIGSHWLGFTAPGLTEGERLAVFEIIKIGLGGYVLGRSAEKGIKAWKAK